MSNYEVADKGTYFEVHIYEDHVIKYPKHKRVMDPEKLEYIAEQQTFLSTKIEAFLPCKKVGNTLIMPKAPGVRADKVYGKWPEIQAKALEAIKQAKELGLKVTDVGKDNVFYDEKTDKIYIIDCHNIKPYKKKVKK